MEALRSYANRADLLEDLRLTVAAIHEESAEELPVPAEIESARPHRLADRLDGATVQEIIAGFLGGRSRDALAQEYGISVRSVGRLLKRYRDECEDATQTS